MGPNNDKKLERVLRIIIRSTGSGPEHTRRIKRPIDLVTLYQYILYAAREVGSLETLADRVKLSVQQLKDFLTVEKLCDDVKTLVRVRSIDSVDIVKTISGLPTEKQKVLADYLVRGRINSKDIRIITTFAKKFPDKLIKKVIADYEKSKDVKTYVLQFRLPSSFNNQADLHKHFERIVGKGGIKTLQFKGKTAVLELTTQGYKELRVAVRKKQTTLRKFVTSLIEKLTGRK